MTKKIIFVALFCCILTSCGMKGDPEYKDPKKEVKIQTSINKA